MISKWTIQQQKSHSALLTPFATFDTGKVRKHSEHVTAIVPLSFLTQTAAWFGLPVLGRVGSSCSKSINLLEQLLGVVPAFGKEGVCKHAFGYG
jgi:hypothetical protein